MPALDLKKELKQLYNPSSKEPTLLEVPGMNFLMIDGQGDPNTSPNYTEAVQTLYSLAYTLKFMLKKEEVADYSVPPLEGLWWVEDMAKFDINRKNDWLWTMLIMQPKAVTPQYFQKAQQEITHKKGFSNLAQVRLEQLEEGLSAQLMHLGPYSAEGPTVAQLHDFIENQGYKLSAKHHEIYLSDPRRVAPEKMKTVIRQPVAK